MIKFALSIVPKMKHCLHKTNCVDRQYSNEEKELFELFNMISLNDFKYVYKNIIRSRNGDQKTKTES